MAANDAGPQREQRCEPRMQRSAPRRQRSLEDLLPPAVIEGPRRELNDDHRLAHPQRLAHQRTHPTGNTDYLDMRVGPMARLPETIAGDEHTETGAWEALEQNAHRLLPRSDGCAEDDGQRSNVASDGVECRARPANGDSIGSELRFRRKLRPVLHSMGALDKSR